MAHPPRLVALAKITTAAPSLYAEIDITLSSYFVTHLEQRCRAAVDSRDHSDAAFDRIKGRDILIEDSTGAYWSRCNKTGAANLVAVRLTCIGKQTAIEFYGGDASYDGLTVDLAGRTGKTWVFSLAAGSGKNLVKLRNCRFTDSIKPGGKLGPLSKESIFMGKGPGVAVDADASCSAWPK